MNIQNAAKQVEEALQSEYQLYHNILGLSKKQIELISEKEVDDEQIALLMDQKVQIINEIEMLEAQNLNIKQEWENVYQSHSVEDRNAVRESRDQLTELLEVLQQMEQQLTEYLQNAGVDINEHLRRIYQSRSINRAYFNMEKNPPQYVNRLSK